MAPQKTTRSSSPSVPSLGAALFFATRSKLARWSSAANDTNPPEPAESAVDDSDAASISKESDSSSVITCIITPSSGATASSSSSISAEGNKPKAILPGGFICLTAEPQPNSSASAASTAEAEKERSEIKSELAENKQRINELTKSYEKHLSLDAAHKRSETREKRQRSQKRVDKERASAAVLAGVVPFAQEGSSCSPAKVRGMARSRPKVQMTPDSNYPNF